MRRPEGWPPYTLPPKRPYINQNRAAAVKMAAARFYDCIGLEFLWFFLCKERTPRFSTKFSVINSAYSTGRVEKRRFPGFPQKSPQTVQNNPRAIFRGAIGSRGVFHDTNTPYYDYYHSLIVSANGTAKYTSSHLQNTAPTVENRRSTLPRDC